MPSRRDAAPPSPSPFTGEASPELLRHDPPTPSRSPSSPSTPHPIPCRAGAPPRPRDRARGTVACRRPPAPEDDPAVASRRHPELLRLDSVDARVPVLLPERLQRATSPPLPSIAGEAPPPASSLSSRRRAVYYAPSGMPLFARLARIACVRCRPRSALPLLAPPRRPVPSPRHAAAPAPATRRPLPPPPLLAASGAGAHAPAPAPFRPRRALASPSGRVREAQPWLARHSRRPTLGH
nr:vegetative cell wall protein gp1-like [Aegilops tauschii subsp. strangulata]